MQDILKTIKNLGSERLFSRNMGDIAAIGAAGGARANLAGSFDSFVLCVTADSISASGLAEELAHYGKRAVLIPAREEVLLYNKAASNHLAFERFSALHKIISGNADAAVISADALARRFPPKDRFQKAVIRIEKGGSYDISLLVNRLARRATAGSILPRRRGSFP